MTRRTFRSVRTLARRGGAVAGTVMLLALTPSAAAPRFFSDDPLAREEDPFDASQVRPFPIHLSWDLISGLFEKPRDRAVRRSTDINTIGEVPDSSWFTNRAGSRPLTEPDVARGPDTTDGPATGRWTVVAGKSEGVRPGFTIVDSAGIRWFLKFDPPGFPEQATGAEVVATKVFWALGYNVAETHVATLWRKDLVLGADATITINGKRRRLTNGDIDRVLAQVERRPDGGYRALASKALDGKPLGGFLYYGTRSDDPNDIVPHENRRELRGMGVFAAWIDRVDAKAGNTLDTLVSENGKTAVRHHVLDFGSTLGSGGIAPNEYWEGYEYIYEGSSLLKKLFWFGFPIESWRTIPYPHLRGVGRFEGDRFDPEAWKSRVPNAAYLRAESDDTFWAARKVTAFSDGMITAAVRSGKYSDPAAEAYLIQALIKRRDAIGRTYLGKINPVVNPLLDPAGVLKFENAAAELDPSVAPLSYRAEWFQFDNATGDSTPFGASASSEPAMHVPSALPNEIGSFVRVDISALSPAHPAWAVPLHTYFRRSPDDWTLVGLERTSSSPSRDVAARRSWSASSSAHADAEKTE